MAAVAPSPNWGRGRGEGSTGPRLNLLPPPLGRSPQRSKARARKGPRSVWTLPGANGSGSDWKVVPVRLIGRNRPGDADHRVFLQDRLDEEASAPRAPVADLAGLDLGVLAADELGPAAAVGGLHEQRPAPGVAGQQLGPALRERRLEAVEHRVGSHAALWRRGSVPGGLADRAPVSQAPRASVRGGGPGGCHTPFSLWATTTGG